MEDIDSSPIASSPLKRPAPVEHSPSKKPLNLKGTQFIMPTPPDTDQSSNSSPSYMQDTLLRGSSPALSTSTLTSMDTASPAPNGDPRTTQGAIVVIATDSTTGQPPAKRRKLTLAEKEQQQKEKEVKAAEREAKAIERAAQAAKKEEERLRREEDKAKRDEEKRVRDVEKRRKAEEKDAKRREKEVEEERKVEAKLKKERSQMRLGAFFQRPATIAQSPDDTGAGFVRRKSLSLEPFEAAVDRIRASESPCKRHHLSVTENRTPAKENISDYRKYFLPFELQTHCWLPLSARPTEEIDVLQDIFDKDIHSDLSGVEDKTGLGDAANYFKKHFAEERRTSRGIPQPNMRQLIDQIQGSSSQPVDLTADVVTSPMDVFHSTSRRHIQFDEDVRPAYFGTYTKIRSPQACMKFQRNPFVRARDDTDYDYDSETEWQEEGEGDDILDDDDEEAESVGEAGEMDAFLDDEDDSLKGKQKLLTADLVPTSTGLCWENEAGKIVHSIENNDPDSMRDMRIGFLLPGFTGNTIDPFSEIYWQSEPVATPAKAFAPLRESPFTPATGLMAPPRPPLQPRPNSNGPSDGGLALIGAAEGMKGPINSAIVKQKAKSGPKPAPKTLSTEDLEEFKEAVVGSQLNKIELLKGLKSRFPKLTHDTIKGTLGERFAQVGATKADKKWVFVSAT